MKHESLAAMSGLHDFTRFHTKESIIEIGKFYFWSCMSKHSSKSLVCAFIFISTSVSSLEHQSLPLNELSTLHFIIKPLQVRITIFVQYFLVQMTVKYSYIFDLTFALVPSLASGDVDRLGVFIIRH